MEAKYKSISIYEFNEKFNTEEKCLLYLSRLKWSNGYVCKKCGHTKYCSSKNKFAKQCTKCRYIESPTANTLFHKVKFSLVKAFSIIYFVSTSKKGISSTELSRKLQLRQKTCWLFKQKVMQAMKSMSHTRLVGHVEILNCILGRKKISVKGKIRIKKKHVILAIEKKGKGVSRIYGRVLNNLNQHEIVPFIQRYIEPSTKIYTSAWSGIPNFTQNNSYEVQKLGLKKSNHLTLAKRVAKGVKAWLRGIHGHAEHLQFYLDEYGFRFNRNRKKEKIFDILIQRMMVHPPRTYYNILDISNRISNNASFYESNP